jgi:hypothetical protein
MSNLINNKVLDEKVIALFNLYVSFLESCKKDPNRDKLISIFEKRMNEGILPKTNYSTYGYDYTYNLGDLVPYLSEFDKMYYPEKLISDEISLKTDPIIENLHKFNEFILSINVDSFDSPDITLIFLNELGNIFYQFETDISTILFENKKDLFVYILYKKVNPFLSNLKIKPLSIEDINSFLKEDNKNNFLHFHMFSLENYLRDNHEKEESIFKNVESFKNIINSTMWYVYSYEFRFFDNFLEIKNKYQEPFYSKLEELQILLNNKFTVIRTVDLDDGTVEEEKINLLEKTFEFYEDLEDKFRKNVDSKIKSSNTETVNIKDIVSQEIDDIISSLENMTPIREKMIRDYLGISSIMFEISDKITQISNLFSKIELKS